MHRLWIISTRITITGQVTWISDTPRPITLDGLTVAYQHSTSLLQVMTDPLPCTWSPESGQGQIQILREGVTKSLRSWRQATEPIPQYGWNDWPPKGDHNFVLCAMVSWMSLYGDKATSFPESDGTHKLDWLWLGRQTEDKPMHLLKWSTNKQQAATPAHRVGGQGSTLRIRRQACRQAWRTAGRILNETNTESCKQPRETK